MVRNPRRFRSDEARRGRVDSYGLRTRMTPALDSENPVTARDPLTVSALNRAVAGLLTRSFPLVRVRGEIANLARASSGHWYFTLKDAAAQVRCAMFRARNALLDFSPREGDEIEVLAQVNLYEARGEYQLNIESMQRAGLGRLFEEFLRLKAGLGAEGLFDEARKRPLPVLPRAIGIVTSLQAAALRDVLTTLGRRARYLRLIVYPVPVQGEGAGAKIAQMLAQVSRRNEVDVVLLVRGGGSIEDLWAFNEEVVARAIRASSIPIIVGVGHESDFTIADFAADLRAPTPTAAAELAAPDGGALLGTVSQQLRALRLRLQRRTEMNQQRFDYALRALSAPRAPLRGVGARLLGLQTRLVAALGSRRAAWQTSLMRRAQTMAQVRPQVHTQELRLRDARGSLSTIVQRAWAQRNERFGAALRAIELLDPRRVLERGYSIVRDEAGRVVRTSAVLRAGAAVEMTFSEGAATARIEATRSS